MRDIFVWSTIILTIWAAVGPLVGVRYGHLLAKRWQQQHWRNDNAKQECSELISTMADTFTVHLKFYALSSKGRPISGPHGEAERREHERAYVASLEIFHSRLFISEELERLNTRSRWVVAMRDYQEERNVDKFSHNFHTLIGEVRKLAEGFIV